jgi:sirohydrochlorin cobaltochelatase
MRNHKRIAVLGILLLSLIIGTNTWADDHKNKKPQKIGILLVAFGSSLPEAQVSFINIDNKVRAAFPEVPVRWAYTSRMIRKKLAGQGKLLDSPEGAMHRRQ